MSAYSVLTHEAIIDSSWPKDLRPLLLKRFPNATDDQLRDAHAYAYGGAIIQDMGYYPFGSKLFSDLVHYTRSGDFVIALVKDAQEEDPKDPQTLNDYAFALGALAHYAADNQGHPVAVNRTVPMVYPKLRAKFGPEITYEDNPSAHLKTEFGFDVIEVARGQYANDAYHDFIGFKVAKPLLERAFEQTYCVPLKDLFHQSGSGARHLSLVCQPGHSGNDEGGLVGQEEGHSEPAGGHDPAPLCLSHLSFRISEKLE